ncbi:MATE family efflux transporter [Vibrio cionasavignyae]|uniref:MATE family efflux transporter n=1 Tax=Vibrio cionasavignyae TaxID=2910252 RepID=UPI003D0E9669
MSIDVDSMAKRNRQGILSRELLKSILVIAIPVTLQTILFSSKGLVDLIMVGQLSETDIAAAGVASRALFVATILLSGVMTGGAVLTAQYFGAKQPKSITRSIALTWLMTTLAATIPLLLFWGAGNHVVGLSSRSPEVMILGHEYLKITALSLFFIAFTGSVSAGLRSIHQAAVSTWFSAIGIALNMLLNWVLIFGMLGAPALGLKGAAIATLISCGVEMLLMLIYLRYKQHLLNFGLQDIIQACQFSHISRFAKLSIPTTINFLTWAAGLFCYTAIMGQTGDQGLVALSVITPIEAFSLSFLVGIANASAVIVGNQLGEKNAYSAYQHAIAFTFIAVAVTIIVAICLWLLKDQVLGLFSVLTPETRALADKFYLILCLGIILRSLPTTMVVGVLRAGGDVKFCLYQDLMTQWLFGIPLAALGALFFGFEPEVVFAMFFLETLFKWFLCVYRFRSKKWINFLTKE